MTDPAETAAGPRPAARSCVIVPAYQEAQRIGAVVRKALQHVQDVVVIDDGSTDQTADAAQRAGATVLRHPQNRGKGVALNTGFAYARARGFELVITMDADAQHDAADIPRFIEAHARTGTPVLVGDRMGDAAHMPWVRRMTNRFMSWLLSRAMRQAVPDTQCGYRLYHGSVLPVVCAESERFAAESETLLHLADRGIRIASVPIAALYGAKKSAINPWTDTLRFFAMLRRHRAAQRRERATAPARPRP